MENEVNRSTRGKLVETLVRDFCSQNLFNSLNKDEIEEKLFNDILGNQKLLKEGGIRKELLDNIFNAVFVEIDQKLGISDTIKTFIRLRVIMKGTLR